MEQSSFNASRMEALQQVQPSRLELEAELVHTRLERVVRGQDRAALDWASGQTQETLPLEEEAEELPTYSAVTGVENSGKPQPLERI